MRAFARWNLCFHRRGCSREHHRVIVAAVFALGLLVQVPGDTRGWLEVSGPTTGAPCDAAALLAGAVEAELGGAPFAARDGVRVRCHIFRDGGALSARIELLDLRGLVSGRREISSASGRCSDLSRAVILSLSVALAAPPPEPAPMAARSAATPPPPLDADLPPTKILRTSAISRDPLPSSDADWHLQGGVGAIGGVLPGPAVSAALGTRRVRGAFQLGFELAGDWALPATLGPIPVTSWRLTGGALACRQGGRPSACALVRAGALRAVGASASHAPVLEVGARLSLAFAPWGRPAALYLEPVFSLVRTRLLAEGLPVWDTPWLAVGAGVRLTMW